MLFPYVSFMLSNSSFSAARSAAFWFRFICAACAFSSAAAARAPPLTSAPCAQLAALRDSFFSRAAPSS